MLGLGFRGYGGGNQDKKFETVAEHRVGGGDPGSGLQQLLPQRSSFRVQGLFAELLFPTARHRFPKP